MDNAMIVTVPEEKQEEIKKLLNWASQITVTNETIREQAMEVARGAKKQKKWFKDLFDPNISKANKLHKSLVAQKRQFTDLLDNIEDKLKSAIGVYDRKQKAIQEAEQRRLQAAEEAKRRKEEERLRKEADKIKTPEIKQARLEEAEEVKATIPVIPPPAPQKRKGESTRITWKARVTDKNLVPREYMFVDVKVLNALARATKGSIKVAGVVFYEDSSLAIR